MHEVFLKRAIDIASKGKYLTKPNPMVGCVIAVSYTHLTLPTKA